MLGERKQGGSEGFFYQMCRDSARNVSDYFSKEFNISEVFGLTSVQEDIFKAYFAAYFTSKSGAEIGYLAKRQESEVILNIPIVGSIAKMLFLMNNTYEIVTREYNEKAKTLASGFKDELDINKPAWIRNIANRLSTVYVQHRKDTEKLNEEVKGAIERIKEQRQ